MASGSEGYGRINRTKRKAKRKAELRARVQAIVGKDGIIKGKDKGKVVKRLLRK